MYIKRPECGNFAHLFEDVLDLMKRADLRPVECVEQVELGRVEGRLCRKDATKPLVRVLVRQLGTGAGVRQLQTNSRHRRAWGKANRTNAYKVAMRRPTNSLGVAERPRDGPRQTKCVPIG